jgi:undecaprenyl pyrophosphate phosphatase UppP
MTLLQGLIQAFTSTFFEILPNSGEIHRELLIQIFGWEHPTSTLLGLFQLSAFLALFFTFRSEWASIFSESLQTLLFQKKQGTLDERMPLFLAVALIPGLLISHFYAEQISELSLSAYFKAILFCLRFAPPFSRTQKQKNKILL